MFLSIILISLHVQVAFWQLFNKRTWWWYNVNILILIKISLHENVGRVGVDSYIYWVHVLVVIVSTRLHFRNLCSDIQLWIAVFIAHQHIQNAEWYYHFYPSVCPMPGLCLKEYTYRYIFDFLVGASFWFFGPHCRCNIPMETRLTGALNTRSRRWNEVLFLHIHRILCEFS